MSPEKKKVKTEVAAKGKPISMEKKPLPDLRIGQRVRVKQKIVEGEKERLQTFEGTIIAMSGKTDADRSMTVRRVAQGYGVERIFPLASPNVVEIEIIKTAAVRRSKLYYLRSPKAKPLKEEAVAQSSQR